MRFKTVSYWKNVVKFVPKIQKVLEDVDVFLDY